MLVDREVQDRDNRRLQRYLKAARLRSNASVEDLDFRRPRGLDRSAVLSLAESQWVDARRNLLIVAPTGAGKTFVACALAQAAIRQGHSALYLRSPRMLGDLALARADGRLPRLMTAWAKVGVLVIDDLALRPLAPDQAADLLEVIEDRYQLRSTIVTSQLPVSEWHDALGEPTIADAILDRLVHNPTASSCAATRYDALRSRQVRSSASPITASTPPSDRPGGVAPKNEPLQRPRTPADEAT